jgi:hypothetical protein
MRLGVPGGCCKHGSKTSIMLPSHAPKGYHARPPHCDVTVGDSTMTIAPRLTGVRRHRSMTPPAIACGEYTGKNITHRCSKT